MLTLCQNLILFSTGRFVEFFSIRTVEGVGAIETAGEGDIEDGTVGFALQKTFRTPCPKAVDVGAPMLGEVPVQNTGEMFLGIADFPSHGA